MDSRFRGNDSGGNVCLTTQNMYYTCNDDLYSRVGDYYSLRSSTMAFAALRV
jgi:hypothetical protein